MDEWDPKQYLKFRNERTRPSIDLVSRIGIENPESIIDIGCGPGNSTRILRSKWPNSKIVGVDNSAEMISRAKKDFPGGRWILTDASRLEENRAYNIIFSNAALQWIPNHKQLMQKLMKLVKPEGVLAVQLPANNRSVLHTSLMAVAQEAKWKEYVTGCDSLLTYHEAEFYYNVLIPFSGVIDMWETTYYHVLGSHVDMIEWYKSTGMKPFLQRLPCDAYRREFEKAILEKCRKMYPIQKNGDVLYPFRRLFFIAYKKA